MNLYGFVGNNGVNRWDILGRVKIERGADKFEVQDQLGGELEKKADGQVLGAARPWARLTWKITVETIEGEERCCVRLDSMKWWIHVSLSSDRLLKDSGEYLDFSSRTGRFVYAKTRSLSHADFYKHPSVGATAEGIRRHEMIHHASFVQSATPEVLNKIASQFDQESENAHNLGGKCFGSQPAAITSLKNAEKRAERRLLELERVVDQVSKDFGEKSGFEETYYNEAYAVKAEREYYERLYSSTGIR